MATVADALPRPCPASFPSGVAASSCPACGSGGGREFFAVSSIPAHSSVLLSSREVAARHPRGELLLAHCPDCSFIWNTRFDASKDAVGLAQESTQGFSPTFSAFAKQLAAALTDRHRLTDRDVVEIGCGDGDFLSLLCDTAACRGVGYDPLANPGRVNAKRVTIVRDHFGPRHGPLLADLVVCRHTLEHIPDVAAFLRMLRASIDPDRRTAVFFEVPDVTRQLHEGAFWDFYHEHCSYFSPGSMSRAFDAAGFAVDRVERAYGDQYLLLTARAGDPHDGRGRPIDAREEIAPLVESYPARCAAAIRRWRDFIDARAAKRRRIVLWGSGSKAAGFLATLGLHDEIAAVVDANPRKDGRFMPGLPQEIVAPARLASIKPEVVIIMNPVYVGEIRDQLAGMNLHPELTALSGDVA